MRTSEHGTLSHYNNHGCRCDPCKAAQTIYRHEYQARKAAGLPARTYKPKVEHGTVNGYQHHKCRCDLCRAAIAQRRREQRQGRRPVQTLANSVPVAPLWARVESVAGAKIDDLTDDQVAELCGVARETVQRWRVSGYVSFNITDRVAINLGWHPAVIWGIDWYIDTALKEAA